MGTPTMKLMFDRQKRASKTKEGSIELRITLGRVKKHATTGVRVFPREWRNGHIVNRLDAYELQRTLDMYVAHARKVINDLTERGELDIDTIVSVINGKQREASGANVAKRRLLLDYMRERAEIRKYGRGEDSRERYDRFLRWFEGWGGMMTFDDITETNILAMDRALSARGMQPYSKWQNYHRFLNSFILDANEDGLMRGNPYRKLNLKKQSGGKGLEKYLTREEFGRIERLDPPVNYLRHARDLFVFQTYTCLSYTDLASFDASRIKEVNGRKMYVGLRGKTGMEYKFLLMGPALAVLERYGGRLPIMSNVKYNAYLKVIAVMCGIRKPVSTHWARHTGATLLLNSGVGMEVVSRVLGHSSTKITREVYAALLDETVAEAMSKMERVMAGD
ncbi:MAG: tyrosine-type recombinase/integrase [Muribaculaceae bacterium]|nr:tyrosine-type recombinase/integrase [Muribaculaceae bacterium]